METNVSLLQLYLSLEGTFCFIVLYLKERP